MIHVITVSPCEGDWIVEADALGAPARFASGAKAEAFARALAEQLAAGGAYATIRIFARDGALVGRFLCTPHTIGGDPRSDAGLEWAAPGQQRPPAASPRPTPVGSQAGA